MSKTLEITLVSFGHKHGRPEADLFFDLRSLPNPYWKEELRTLNGQDLAVIEFFENSEEFLDALADIETKIMTKLYDLEQDFHVILMSINQLIYQNQLIGVIII